MKHEDPPSPELDLSRYPDRVGCKIMPQIEQDVSEVEIIDAEGNAAHAKVAAPAVQSFKVHRLVEGLPEEHKKIFDDQLATGMVRCRIVERFENENLVKIELPDGSHILVSAERLARPR